MSYGYSSRLIELNKEADNRLLGVQLGRVCIEKDVSVAEVSEELGVTRQTVYNWFCGANAPRSSQEKTIKEFLQKIS